MATYQTRGLRLDFSAGDLAFGQGLARVVGLKGGGFGVTWIGDDNNALFHGSMFGRVFDSNLNPTTADTIALIRNTGPNTFYPVNQALSDLSTGGFALLSIDNARVAGTSDEVALRLYNASGGAIGEPIFLSNSSVLGLTLATLGNGQLVAGWVGADGGIRAQMLTETGGHISGSFQVSRPSGSTPVRPVFSAIGADSWVATYVDQNTAQGHAIFYRSNAATSADIVVANGLPNTQGLQAEALADGATVFVWTTTNASQQLETRAQIYSPDGAPSGDSILVSSTSSSIAGVTALADGGFAVAIEPSESAPMEIKAFNSIGQQSGSTILINGAIEPSISALADGGFVVAWRESGSQTLHAQAYLKIAAGDLMLNGSAGGEILVGQEGNDVISGLAGADQLFGSVGDDRLNGGGGNDRLSGGLGADILEGGAGDDALDGGLGVDRASYGGLFRSYGAEVATGVLTLHGDAAEGTDTLTDVENISFKDGVLVSDPDSVAAQVIRLYDTVLGRAPDRGGLDFYVDRMEDNRVPLVAVANEIAGSSEFQQATGGLNNALFVDYVYQHALGRAPDAGGATFYTQKLNSGALSRGDFVVDLSESAEHRYLTADAVAQGFFNTDDNYQTVSLLYDSFLGRLPDVGGITFYGDSLKNGTLSLSQISADFAGSAEFKSATDSLSNAELVDYIYQNTLDRDADGGGRAFYIERLDHGFSRAAFVQEVTLSQEHYNLMLPFIVEGIQLG